MRKNSLATALLLLAFAPFAWAEPIVATLGEPIVAISAPLSAASPLAVPPSIFSPELAAEPLAALDFDRQVRASLGKAVAVEAAKLASLTEHMTYAQSSGAKLVLVPFDGQQLPHLSADALAQAEPGEQLVYLNWSLARSDRYGLERAGLSAAEAQRVTALSLAPVVGHELRHLELRHAAGRDFPGLREEEILTHLDQAEAVDEVFRANPELQGAKNLLNQQFVYLHNDKLLSRWKERFGSVVDYVVAKYSNAPSLSDPRKNAEIARELREAWGNDPAVPAIWREKIGRAVEFWEDPDAVAAVTSLIQDRINAAYARYQRLRAR